MTEILCTICARGGSKGVLNKNIKMINNRPLITYTIKQALDSNLFTHVVVSTDSDEIANTARDNGAEVFFKRSQELSNDTAGKIDVIKDALLQSEYYYNKKFKYLVDLDATAPLRNIDDIRKSFEQFKTNNNDNLITAMHSRRSPYFNLIEMDKNGKISLSKQINKGIQRRQDVPKSYDMNASIYIWKRDVLLKNDTLFLDNTGLYVMPEERSIDIDSELDFKFVEFIMKNKNVE